MKSSMELPQKTKTRAVRVAQVEEDLFSKHEGHEFKPQSCKKQNKTKD
jgi:hypothetical protein